MNDDGGGVLSRYVLPATWMVARFSVPPSVVVLLTR
jgi:hypothetical protein